MDRIIKESDFYCHYYQERFVKFRDFGKVCLLKVNDVDFTVAASYCMYLE